MIEVVSYTFDIDVQRLEQLLVRDAGQEMAVDYAPEGDTPRAITVLGLPETPASIESVMVKGSGPFGPVLNPPVLISTLREAQARAELIAGLLEHNDAPDPA